MRKKQEKRHWVQLFSPILALLVMLLGSFAGRPPTAAAQSCLATQERQYLVPVGKAVGIKLFSHGVLVVGFAEGDSSAKRCGLRVGDLITEIDGERVNSIEEVNSVLNDAPESIAISALRNGRQLSLEAEPVPCMANGSRQLGVWVRDSMAGIGTVTYYDPETGRFGALGHGVADVDTSVLLPLRSGSIMSAKVTGILKGAAGAPGQLHGSFDQEHDCGSLCANTDQGVFGTLAEGEQFGGEALPVAHRSEIHTGKATILSNISGDQVEEYEVEIQRVYPEALSDTRNLLIEMKDERLLEATGGVVQGMSGSPILQDGRLVGAVTHVLVNDPTKGYGILAENMMKAAE